VVLDYGGLKTQQNLVVALDPRLHATQQDLEARLALDLQIHRDLDALDKDIDQAIATRDSLAKTVAGNPRAGDALSALNRDIGELAQMKMSASEGALLFETKLRDHLAYLAADVDLAYARPTQAHYEVFKMLDAQAKAGQEKLKADVAQAEKYGAAATGGQ
jgi:hypothetical protein